MSYSKEIKKGEGDGATGVEAWDACSYSA